MIDIGRRDDIDRLAALSPDDDAAERDESMLGAIDGTESIDARRSNDIRRRSIDVRRASTSSSTSFMTGRSGNAAVGAGRPGDEP